MASRPNHAGVLPWPRTPVDLECYRPDQWPVGGKQFWHATRSTWARSLGRKCLPEVQAMSGHGPLADYCGGQGK